MSTAPDDARPPEGPAAVDAYLAAQPEPARAPRPSSPSRTS